MKCSFQNISGIITCHIRPLLLRKIGFRFFYSQFMIILCCKNVFFLLSNYEADVEPTSHLFLLSFRQLFICWLFCSASLWEHLYSQRLHTSAPRCCQVQPLDLLATGQLGINRHAQGHLSSGLEAGNFLHIPQAHVLCFYYPLRSYSWCNILKTL